MKALLFSLLVFAIPAASFADSNKYDDLISQYSKKNGLDFYLVKSLIRAESNFQADALSSAGALGLMQMMPATASRFNVTKRDSPEQSIRGGTTYLKWLLKRFNGNVEYALAGYNAGEGRVDKYNGVPPFKETRSYIARIKRFYKGYTNKDLVRNPVIRVAKSKPIQPKQSPKKPVIQPTKLPKKLVLTDSEKALLTLLLKPDNKKAVLSTKTSFSPGTKKTHVTRKAQTPLKAQKAVLSTKTSFSPGTKKTHLPRVAKASVNERSLLDDGVTRIYSMTRKKGQVITAGYTRIRSSKRLNRE